MLKLSLSVVLALAVGVSTANAATVVDFAGATNGAWATGTATIILAPDGTSFSGSITNTSPYNAHITAFGFDLGDGNLNGYSGSPDPLMIPLTGVNFDVTNEDHAWSVSVRLPPQQPTADAIDVAGEQRVFSDAGSLPLTLRNTALSAEFGVPPTTPDVTGLRSDHLTVAVAALPGGFVDVVGRSGMTGRFSYTHPPEPAEVGDAVRRNRE